MSGQFGRPPQKSGPPTGIIVAIIMLVILAVGCGDDDDESGTQDTSGTTQPGEVTTLPTGDQPPTTGTTLPELSAAAQWVFENTPGSVDEVESACLADIVIGVIGEERVAAANGDMSSIYTQTSVDQDLAISGAYPSCLDEESVAEMASDAQSWPWP